ncbi:MAG: anaerobic ribonucleoside-triphosphate reductase activating protein [Nitrososphaerota archaeon]
MRIGGFQKVSLVEYPGKVSTVVFTVGCNFRCPFCYVPWLVIPDEVKEVRKDEVLSYIKRRAGLIDAVVVTGGEPTLQESLPDFFREVRRIGLLTGIETNGSNFFMLEKLVRERLVDYVAMDIKTALEYEKYKKVTGSILTRELFENVKRSLSLLMESGISYEFRTTLVKEYHTKEDIIEICKSIEGAKIYYLQNLQPTKRLLGGEKLTPFSEEEIEGLLTEGRRYVNIVYRRGYV